ncbi:MAG: N-acetyl-gamma-glutamyl-phosphate reductase [Clostridia bacterium]
MTNVFIDGQEGTTGLKLLSKLQTRDDINILRIAEEDRKNTVQRAKLLNSCDIAFLCLPDVAAVEAVALVTNTRTRIIDSSTAHRTAQGWTYGFAELFDNGDSLIANSMRVAVPGCHASGFLSIVKPLVDGGIIPRDCSISCSSLTGYSGGGKKMIAEYESPTRDIQLRAPRAYALTQSHKHLREMSFVSGLTITPIFQPIVFDFYSGMAVSIPLDLKKLGVTKADVCDCLSDKYRNQPLVRVAVDGGESVSNGFVSANALFERDDMELTINGNDERIVITSVFDNLGKGASGSAIECMNLMIGCDKTKGLNCKKKENL